MRVRNRDLIPSITDPIATEERRRGYPWDRKPRSTDAVANALSDIRDTLSDLALRVEELEAQSEGDNTSLDNDLRELTDRIDNLENAVDGP